MLCGLCNVDSNACVLQWLQCTLLTLLNRRKGRFALKCGNGRRIFGERNLRRGVQESSPLFLLLALRLLLACGTQKVHGAVHKFLKGCTSPPSEKALLCLKWKFLEHNSKLLRELCHTTQDCSSILLMYVMYCQAQLSPSSSCAEL